MNLELTAEQQDFRDSVRQFADRELQPQPPPSERLLPLLADQGLMGIAVPRAYGGRGLDTVSACLAIRELATACPSTAVTVHVNNFVFCAPLFRFGSEAQKQQWLVPTARGRQLGAFALTEPDAGADPSRLSATARATDQGYLLNGRKAWVTNGQLASHYLAVARLDPAEGPVGTGLFIMGHDTPGLTVGRREETLGLQSARVTELLFEDCAVPRSQLVGPGQDGLQLALKALLASRIGVAAQSVGIARGALAWVRQEEIEPALLARVAAANLMMLHAAWQVDRDEVTPGGASMAKLICSEGAVEAAAAALQLAGPNAAGENHPSARFWRDARVTTIYGGPSEIQRGIIARELLKKPR